MSLLTTHYSLLTTMLSMIAAIGKNRELGKNNALLWDIPEDMNYFRDRTRGHTVIMGQKTFEAIGRPLPKRRNIVLTRDKDFSFPGVDIVYTPEDALSLAGNEKLKMKNEELEDEEVFIIGGAMIYSLFLPKTDRLYLTLIDAEFPDADVYFPEYRDMFTKEVSRRESRDENFTYTFSVLEKF